MIRQNDQPDERLNDRSDDHRGALITQFEIQWHTENEPAPAIDEYLVDGAGTEHLCELVKIDMECRQRREGRLTIPTVELYLNRYPELNQPQFILEMLEEEIWLSLCSGIRPDSKELSQRFPELSLAITDRLEWTIEKWNREYAVSIASPAGLSGTGMRGQGSSTVKSVSMSSDRAADDLPAIPGYEVIQLLGRGGMASVFQARHLALDRIVAIKIPKADMDEANESKTRLEKEAKSAARLKHPNIVEIFEVGEWNQRAYFAMEYVPGGTLAEFIDGPVAPDVVVAILLDIAQGMKVAHQHQIIHRDLKPSNILLEFSPGGSKDQIPVPKIADFGLARNLDEQLLTNTGALIGTPSYMSPEQTRGGRDLIGPASDIYALGATLYHMLTGRTPFVGATSLETMQQILVDDPVPPHKCERAIPAELSAICMKCLEKTPSHRYTTVEHLIQDLENYRQHRPITARPPSWPRRTVKWARRHPTQATLVVTISTVLIAAILGVSLHILQLQSALNDVAAEKKRADENFEDAFNAVNQMLDETGFVTLDNVPEMDGVREQLANRAIEYYEQLLARTPNPAPHHRQIYQTAQARRALIYLALGKISKSVDAFKTAVDIQRKIVSEQGESQPALVELAVTRINQSMALGMSNDQLGALEALDEAVDLLENIDATEEVQRNLAKAYNNRGNHFRGNAHLELAERNHQDALEIRQRLADAQPDHSALRAELSHSYFNLASVWLDQGRFQEAEKHLEHCERLWKKLVEKEPENWHFVSDLAVCLETRSAALRSLGDIDRALECIQQTLDYRLQLFHLFPETVGYRNGVAMAYHNFGDIYIGAHEMEKARDALQQAVEWRRPLLATQEDNEIYVIATAEDLNNLGIALHSLGTIEQAQAAFEESLDLGASLLKQYPEFPRYVIAVASCQTNYGNLLRDAGECDRSVALLSGAVDLLTALLEKDPTNARVQYHLLTAHGARSMSYGLLGNFTEQLADSDRVVELATADQQLHFLAWRLPTTARVDHMRAMREIEEIHQRQGLTPDMRYNIVCAYSLAAETVLSTELAPDRQESIRKEYIDRGFELLNENELRSFLQTPAMVDHVRADPDLESLRSDPRFSKLLSELQPGKN